jgi:hypothetical protein
VQTARGGEYSSSSHDKTKVRTNAVSEARSSRRSGDEGKGISELSAKEVGGVYLTLCRRKQRRLGIFLEDDLDGLFGTFWCEQARLAVDANLDDVFGFLVLAGWILLKC